MSEYNPLYIAKCLESTTAGERFVRVFRETYYSKCAENVKTKQGIPTSFFKIVEALNKNDESSQEIAQMLVRFEDLTDGEALDLADLITHLGSHHSVMVYLKNENFRKLLQDAFGEIRKVEEFIDCFRTEFRKIRRSYFKEDGKPDIGDYLNKFWNYLIDEQKPVDSKCNLIIASYLLNKAHKEKLLNTDKELDFIDEVFSPVSAVVERKRDLYNAIKFSKGLTNVFEKYKFKESFELRGLEQGLPD